VHAGHPGPHGLQRRRVDVGRGLAEPGPGPGQALVDVRFGGEEPQRDLRRAEAAQCPQGQDQPGFPRDDVVAADEEHPQQVVLHLACETCGDRVVALAGDPFGGPLEDPQSARFPPQLPHQPVVGHPIQPGAGVFGKALVGPCRERTHQRRLDGILRELQMAQSGNASEQGDQPAVFVPEEVLDQAGHGARAARAVGFGRARQEAPAISRISMCAPGIIIPGISFATSSAPS
jgi:hypothetical protein